MRRSSLLALSCVLLGCSFVGWSQAQSVLVPPQSTSATASLIGKKMPSWNIGAKYWMNTPTPVSLNSLPGHVTVIEFFRLDCVHCQDATNARKALFAKYQSQGVKMLGFHSPGDISNPNNRENDWGQVQVALRAWKLPYPIAFDAKRALFDKCGLQFYPTIIVLDKTGTVQFAQSGFTPPKEAQLDQVIGQMIKQGA